MIFNFYILFIILNERKLILTQLETLHKFYSVIKIDTEI